MRTVQMTKSEFKQKFGRKLGLTSMRYLNAGRFETLFKKAKKTNHEKGKSLWGYELVSSVTKSVLRERIRFMKKKIADGVYEDRALVFALNHLRALERRLKTFDKK